MKTVVIILAIIIGYAAVGYAVALCLKAWDGDYSECGTEIGSLWIIFVPYFIGYLIVKYIGRKLAVIPVTIIALIKARESEDKV